MGDNFSSQPVDAFSTPLNGNHHGGPGMGGGYPPAPGMNQNFGGTPNMVSDGFLRNSNSNFGMHPQREGVIINNNNRTQDNYY